jgi:hypothetical protein
MVSYFFSKDNEQPAAGTPTYSPAYTNGMLSYRHADVLCSGLPN